jgi:cytoskeleton protein RodZ
LLLLLGALVLIFLPAIKTGVSEVKSDVMDARPATVTEAKKANSVNMVIAEPEKSAPSVLQNNTPLVSVAPMTSTDAARLVPAPSGATASVTAGLSAGMPSPTFVATPKPPSAADVVVFTAKGQSWVEATDAKGQVVLRRVLNAGEVAGAAGVLPLQVVIGRANETQVQIRGKAFDVNAVAKDNVARFEVK